MRLEVDAKKGVETESEIFGGREDMVILDSPGIDGFSFKGG